MSKVWVWLLAIILIGLIIFAVVRFNASRDTGDNPLPEGSSAVTISEQDPAQLGVTVDSVTLADPGFVVIRAVADDGTIGPIVGTSGLLTAGTHPNVNIVMETIPEQRYMAIIYKDNGNGVFDQTTDTVVTDTNGNPIQKEFKVKKAGIYDVK